MDGGLELGCFDKEVMVAGAVGLEECRAEIGADFPVVAEGVDVAGGDAAVEMTADVLDVLRLLGVDVAG